MRAYVLLLTVLMLALLAGCAGEAPASSSVPVSRADSVVSEVMPDSAVAASSTPPVASVVSEAPKVVNPPELTKDEVDEFYLQNFTHELFVVEATRYDGPYGSIEFWNVPATPAEIMLCDKFYRDYLGGEGQEPVESYAWHIMKSVRELTLEEMKTVRDSYYSELLFEYIHKDFENDMDYPEFVTGLYNVGVRAVQADYEYAWHKEKAGQMPDGENSNLWVFVPDREGDLNRCSYTFWGPESIRVPTYVWEAAFPEGSWVNDT